MRRWSGLVAMLLVGAELAIAVPVRAGSRPGASTPASSDAYTARIFTLLNRERARHGLQPLRRGPCATTWAERWSSTLAGTQRLRHQPLKPLLKACGARRAAENIGGGNVSADEMMKTWMNSRAHRANILNPKLRYVGVGAARGRDGRWYAVQDFLGL